MAQAATPWGPGLPCSPKQALALYQLLFRRPAGLRQLQAALLQVQKCQGSPPGLELPAMLLEMERSQQAQEQLLWDLELLTGAGLGLFWPPWAWFGGERGQAQCAPSQHSQLCGRTNGDTAPLSSKLHPPPQAEDSLKQNQQLLEERAALEFQLSGSSECTHRNSELSAEIEGQALDPSSAPDLGRAGSDEDTRWESSGIAAEATPGCLEQNPTTSGNLEQPGNSKFKDLSLREERSQAEPVIRQPQRPTCRSPQGGKDTQRASGLHGLASQGLPVPQDLPKGLGSGLDQEKIGPQTPLRTDPPLDQKGETPETQSGESPQDQKGKEPREGGKGTPQTQRRNGPVCRSKETGQAQGTKSPQYGDDNIAQTWEVARGEATVQPEKEGGLGGHPRVTCRPSGGETSQGGEGESLGLQGRSTPWTQVKTEGHGQRAAVGVSGAPLFPAPPGSGVQKLRHSGEPEVLAAPPGGGPSPAEHEVLEARLLSAIGEQRGGPGDPKAWKAARWAPGEEAGAAQQETALQRLLELQGAARRRRGLERERQRLRVLERLRISGNRHRRVHPLGLPSMAQLPPQEDAARRRHALREQLHQVHQERARWLRALAARNARKFQELLSLGAETPAPGPERPPLPARSGHRWAPRDS